jgi:hypothetical protein
LRKLLSRPRAVAGLSLTYIEVDARLFHARDAHYSLHLLDEQDPGRAAAKRLIQDAYRRVFGAHLNEFYPGIATLQSRTGSLEGAVGVRYAASHPLFLEQYLNVSADARLSSVSGRPAGREAIVELGNLSVRRPAQTYPFMNLIGTWLHSYRIEWMLFALTGSLRRLFARSGVAMLELGVAYPSRLASALTDWGSYYDHDPRIVAIHLPAALEQFRRSHPVLRQARRWPLVTLQRAGA